MRTHLRHSYLYISVSLQRDSFTMEQWETRLRAATTVLLTALATFYRSHGGTNGSLITLTNAISDIVHIQEVVTHEQNEILEKERAWRRDAETRLRALEHTVEKVTKATPRANHRNVAREEEAQSASAEASESVCANVDVGSAEIVPVAAESPDSEKTPTESVSLQKPSQESLPVKRNSPSDSPSVSTKSPPPQRSLPSLPTFASVQKDLADRQRRKRRARDFVPLPCDKCRVRKRALMMRKVGYVKEGVFERWTKRPGGCFPILHVEEENIGEYVDPREYRGESTSEFEQSATQSPEGSDKGHT